MNGLRPALTPVRSFAFIAVKRAQADKPLASIIDYEKSNARWKGELSMKMDEKNESWQAEFDQMKALRLDDSPSERRNIEPVLPEGILHQCKAGLLRPGYLQTG